MYIIKDRYSPDCLNIGTFLFFAFFYLYPAMPVIVPFSVAFLSLLFYTFYTSFHNGAHVSKNNAMILICVVYLALLYALFTDARSITKTDYMILKRFISKSYQLSMMLFPLIFCKNIINTPSINYKKYTLIICYAIVSLVIYNTRGELSLNADAARTLSRAIEMAHQGVAGYDFVYTIPFLVILALMAAVRQQKKINMFIFVAISLFLLIFILQSGYTLAFIISFIGVCMFVNKMVRDIRTKLLLSILAIFSYFIIPFILNAIADTLNYGEMAIRFREVSNFMLNGEVGYNLGGRFSLYWQTILAFIDSPIYGNRHLSFDGHATFLCVAADLGLLGAVPFYWLYAKGRQHVLRLIPQEKVNFDILFFMLVLMGVTNPIHAALPVMFTFWFIVPLSLHYLSTYSNKRL